MFYYVSFLRPPPSIAPLTTPVSFTPQVANDLRTELCPDEHDLFYSWIHEADYKTLLCADILSTRASPSTSVPGKPTKLTTWRPANLYKEIKIPPPPGVQDGSTWCLAITVNGQHRGHSSAMIDLWHASGPDRETLGKTPFPVVSMPILFSARGGRTGLTKHEKIERIYRFSSPGRSIDATPPRTVRIVEQTSFDLDKKIWDSGIGLSAWILGVMNSIPESGHPSLAHEVMETVLSTTATVIELGLSICWNVCGQVPELAFIGTGTGIVSLVIAASRSTAISEDEDKAKIYATDLPSALPLLEHNIEINTPSCFPRRPPIPLALDWDEELPDVIQKTDGAELIVMADVTYNTASFQALVKTLERLVKLSVRSGKQPLLLLGYKERDEAERTLWDMVKEIGIDFRKVGEREGASGFPVEIWMARPEQLGVPC
ncbi:hypothetical protein PC9H_006399 [Pleurotus ostreatus]|uniref:Uncharacterized protein n=1 Tax=Pleurotus ostreatus TaxID=5322 RepID=A0A8H6ZW54_PLEOS|nr:uncharacterized protein PC9H_006399 [Pleurotus ostreatus]KAF7430688.1 hypothetical protein PC9H_006399 [Pleurotus ostreatus]